MSFTTPTSRKASTRSRAVEASDDEATDSQEELDSESNRRKRTAFTADENKDIVAYWQRRFEEENPDALWVLDDKKQRVLALDTVLKVSEAQVDKLVASELKQAGGAYATISDSSVKRKRENNKRSGPKARGRKCYFPPDSENAVIAQLTHRQLIEKKASTPLLVQKMVRSSFDM